MEREGSRPSQDRAPHPEGYFIPGDGPKVTTEEVPNVLGRVGKLDQPGNDESEDGVAPVGGRLAFDVDPMDMPGGVAVPRIPPNELFDVLNSFDEAIRPTDKTTEGNS